MKVLMKVLRLPIKISIRIVDLLFKPKMHQLPLAAHDKAYQLIRGHTLYQFRDCPFCVKVRWAMRRMGVDLPYADAKNDPGARKSLAEGGGKIKVPCLHISNGIDQDQWIYESGEIVTYLEQRLSKISL